MLFYTGNLAPSTVVDFISIELYEGSIFVGMSLGALPSITATGVLNDIANQSR